MVDRANHYEAAFESYLRQWQIPYVGLDEARRGIVADDSIKNADFIVSQGPNLNWVVDVKGRRFPSGTKKQYWRNWSTRDDLLGLAKWEQLFGDSIRGLIVIAYHVVNNVSPVSQSELHAYRGQTYAFLGIRLADYLRHARVISPKWDTVAIPARQFREFARPFTAFVTISPEPCEVADTFE